MTDEQQPREIGPDEQLSDVPRPAISDVEGILLPEGVLGGVILRNPYYPDKFTVMCLPDDVLVAVLHAVRTLGDIVASSDPRAQEVLRGGGAFTGDQSRQIAQRMQAVPEHPAAQVDDRPAPGQYL